ncbi:hypothetical protein RchiOBHm_Chr6g0296541 [Rosa chinensis]|uniref:Uncharacterized protein n=1 Tax=Rosa chinensis TaxID=74649 RepID=A0A2P6PXG0_ROSCH|nr:hypothetical protein RchiOBHm_Chr6g0296541 [Rosa chinensis]
MNFASVFFYKFTGTSFIYFCKIISKEYYFSWLCILIVVFTRRLLLEWIHIRRSLIVMISSPASVFPSHLWHLPPLPLFHSGDHHVMCVLFLCCTYDETGSNLGPIYIYTHLKWLCILFLAVIVTEELFPLCKSEAWTKFNKEELS